MLPNAEDEKKLLAAEREAIENAGKEATVSARAARSCADAQPRTATTRLSWHCYRGIVPDPGQPNRRRRARVGAGPHALRSNLPLQSTSRPS